MLGLTEPFFKTAVGCDENGQQFYVRGILSESCENAVLQCDHDSSNKCSLVSVAALTWMTTTVSSKFQSDRRDELIFAGPGRSLPAGSSAPRDIHQIP